MEALNTTEQRAIRLALVGLGKVAVPHLMGYRARSEIEIVGGTDLNSAQAQRMAKQFDIKIFRDHVELLQRTQPDIVVVLTPAGAHRIVTIDAARLRVHVLCEKPMAASIDDAEAMAAECEAQGVNFCYGSSYRYLPAVIEARRLVSMGAIGKPVLLRESVVGGSGAIGRVAKDSSHYPDGLPGGSGMGLVDHGIHLIDVFGWLIDSKVNSVIGHGNLAGKPPVTEFMIMQFENGSVGHLLYNDHTFSTELPFEGLFGSSEWAPGHVGLKGSWQSGSGYFEVLGEAGALRVYHYANRLFLTDAKGQREVFVGDLWASPRHFAAQVLAFAVGMAQGSSYPSASEGLEAMRVLHAAYSASESKHPHWVSL